MSARALSRRAMMTGLAGACLLPVPAFTRGGQRTMFSDRFRHGLGQWRIEAEAPARVSATGGVLDIEAPAGLTLWFLPRLVGRIAIDYEAQAVSEGGAHDRVSDLNCFWMAQDRAAPKGNALARPRTGRFEDYDDLETYYVGLGGNGNSTTRFRRYVGTPGIRPLLPQNDRRGAEDMLVGNRWQRIRLTADGARIGFFRGDRQLFAFDDPAPLASGHFALRTTASHLRIRDFTVSRLA
ncbi:DUF6250 domain-containing protein [Novosphingobium sp. RL4]|uniref:DUF6250 domain-containing protein n=1 Tax=Novosphingobium sp. RL4 TaxID=3109595 RepID=UPI002D79E02C|nr:DUF6250 domain-containing protein [Novosphingobium sp. RL4]WRT94810.1 DUF6250 domain-containing protein [Novosphingobium sp. RL4]